MRPCLARSSPAARGQPPPVLHPGEPPGCPTGSGPNSTEPRLRGYDVGMAARHVRVVAAVIAQDERYLITQRRPAAVLGGLWEFPGGKVEEGETDAAALLREVHERVAVDVPVGACIARRTHDYDG